MVSNRRRGLVLGGLAFSICLMGCHQNLGIYPSELVKLNGFRMGDTIPLTDLAGDEILFTDNTPLAVIWQGRFELSGRFASIAVTNGVFKGTTVDGREFTLRLAEVDRAAVSVLSGKRVLLYTVGGVVAGAILLAVLALVIILGVAAGGGAHP